jgi:predicted dehydrogenase
MSNGAPLFNWGIVGTGRIAQDFADALRCCDEARLLAVASRDSERAKTFAARVGAEYGFGSLAALLDLAELDIVYIATPNHRLRMIACKLLLRVKPSCAKNLLP